MSRLRFATRGSELALAQTGSVIEALRAVHAGLEAETVVVRTTGDRDRTTALWKMGEVGVFTAQVEQALLDGRADVAVHSFKDMPTEATAGLTVAAVPERRWPEDALVALGRLQSLDDLGVGARVGTSSPRRIALLRSMRPDLTIEPVRGNVPTRLRKVDAGQLDAVVVARAGLERLGVGERISLILDPTWFVPAPAQGALAVQCRSDDRRTVEWLGALEHGPTRQVVAAERAVLAGLHPGCHAPVGVHAALETDGTMRIRAFLADTEGRNVIRKEMQGPAARGREIAREMVEQILAEGGREILRAMEKE